MPSKTLLLDANVLIDFQKSDLTILEHVAKTLGRVVVLQETLDEVKAFPEDIVPLGIDVVEERTELLIRARDPIAGLSYQDRLCMLLSREHGWTCVTNDKKLRRECKAHDVTSIYGLRLILDLVAAGAISSLDAQKVAYRIHQSNPHHINAKVMRQFQSRLRDIGR